MQIILTVIVMKHNILTKCKSYSILFLYLETNDATNVIIREILSLKIINKWKLYQGYWVRVPWIYFLLGTLPRSPTIANSDLPLGRFEHELNQFTPKFAPRSQFDSQTRSRNTILWFLLCSVHFVLVSLVLTWSMFSSCSC